MSSPCFQTVKPQLRPPPRPPPTHLVTPPCVRQRAERVLALKPRSLVTARIIVTDVLGGPSHCSGLDTAVRAALPLGPPTKLDRVWGATVWGHRATAVQDRPPWTARHTGEPSRGPFSCPPVASARGVQQSGVSLSGGGGGCSSEQPEQLPFAGRGLETGGWVKEAQERVWGSAGRGWDVAVRAECHRT